MVKNPPAGRGGFDPWVEKIPWCREPAYCILSVYCILLDPLGLDPGTLEKVMATHSSFLTWRIPWTETPGRLQSMGPQRVRDD